MGVATRDFIGADRTMWASDYPHGDYTWPYSGDIIERNFQGVDAETVQRITHDTVTALYNIG